MTRLVHDDVLDASLQYIIDNTTDVMLCAGAPATYANATTDPGSAGNKVGVEDAPSFTGPANGDVSGRKVTLDAISDASVTYTGTADHIAFVDSVNSKLLYVTPLAASQGVTSGNTWNLAACDIEIEDPAAP